LRTCGCRRRRINSYKPQLFVERLLLDTSEQDGKRVRIGFGQDPGQAGKSQALHLVRALDGFTVRPAPESGDKIPIGQSASSSAATGQAATTCWTWCDCEPIRVTR
jgi:phage terminase large subunit-like protein